MAAWYYKTRDSIFLFQVLKYNKQKSECPHPDQRQDLQREALWNADAISRELATVSHCQVTNALRILCMSSIIG